MRLSGGCHKPERLRAQLRNAKMSQGQETINLVQFRKKRDEKERFKREMLGGCNKETISNSSLNVELAAREA